jgi:hypothetical protein
MQREQNPSSETPIDRNTKTSSPMELPQAVQSSRIANSNETLKNEKQFNIGKQAYSTC